MMPIHRANLIAYLLLVGGSLLMLLPLLFYTSEEPVVLGRYSLRFALLLGSLTAILLTLIVLPLAVPIHIERWLRNWITKASQSRSGLELGSVIILVMAAMLGIVSLFAWGVTGRSLAVISGMLLCLAGITISIVHVSSRQRFYQMVKHLALIGFGLVLGLLSCELALRVIFASPRIYALHPPSYRAETRPDPTILPGINGVSVFSTQKTGLRGDPYDPQNYNFLAIGGSTTEQFYLDDSETWTYLLQEALDETATGQAVWVGNTGHAGQNSADHTFVLRYLAPQYRLDAVIMLIGANELAAALSPNPAFVNPDDPDNHETMMRRVFWSTPDPDFENEYKPNLFSVAHRLLAMYIPDANEELAIYQDTTAQWMKARRTLLHEEQTFVPIPTLQPGLNEYEQNLKIMIREADTQNVRLIFVTQPVIYQDNLSPEIDALLWGFYVGKGRGRYDPADLRDAMDTFNLRLLEVCETEQIECIDIAASMNGNPDYFVDDMHFNELGSAKVASLIAEYLAQHPPFTP